MSRTSKEYKENSTSSRFKNDLEAMLAAFQEINLEEMLQDLPDLGCTSIGQALFKAARNAEDEGNQLHYKVLMLLDKVCWTHISSHTPKERAIEAENLDGNDAKITDSFAESDVIFFKQIANLVRNPFLGGKLAEIIWSDGIHRDIQFALLAVDRYKQVPLDADTWFDGGQECWERAINLSRKVGKVAEERLCQMESSLIIALRASTTERGFYGFLLAETLMSAKLGKPHASALATKLESLAKQFQTEGNFHAAGRFYNASGQWFRLHGDEEKSYEMTVLEGDMFENEATARLSSDNRSYRVASGFLGNAIQVYRSIPQMYRDRHRVDQKIQKLRSRISEYNPRAMDEMLRASTPEVDVSEIVNQARSAVAAQSLLDALKAFAELHRVEVDHLRKLAVESLSEFPFRRLFPTLHLGSDGRVIDKTPGLSQPIHSEGNEKVIHAETVEYFYTTNIQIAVLAKILPALDVLHSEHQIGKLDFTDVARRSPIVPKGREILWGKILSYGFSQDFATSLHILAPQIESLVRFHLKRVGAITSHLDQQSIETENSLGRLIRFEESRGVFGKDLTFEIETLFCDPVGPNLRNYIAHGLLDDQECNSTSSIYAWWLAFKLVFQSFWSVAFQDTTKERKSIMIETL
ncbi:MAG: DUF4209 domain-containing protein [Caldilineaceae bacterium]|nr:DUF4209 domain-containing protein [Caldilineaceae bacterium]MDE0338765.1 DUF4209 domain-containing protein [Caldilineaceae bacterium]